ncbi:MAG: DUF2892 domain-containing protein [Chitinophagaceae bacterium]|nr:MAG: DUF2892 domain-containing protein [Chitinophagaceae bacterium]
MNAVMDLITNNQYINTTKTGRVVSAIGGAALIVMALKDNKSHGIAKWVKIGTGATLVLRAISGFCPANKALGINKSA